MARNGFHQSFVGIKDPLDETFSLHPEFVSKVVGALDDDDRASIIRLVAELHYADMADLLEHLEPLDRARLVENMRDNFNSDVLPELDEAVRDDVMDALGYEDFAAAVIELDSDDALDVVGKLDLMERNQILDRLPESYRKLLQHGLEFQDETAGRLMQRELAIVPDYWTVGETLDYLRTAKDLPADFYVIFVVDPRHRPIGMVELSRLVCSHRPVNMRDIVNLGMEAISTDMDREDVANLFRKRDLVSQPVVDLSGRLVGQITIDDVVDVIDEEAEEDILKLAGLKDTNLYDAVLETVRSRFSWLAFNLFTAVLASIVIGWFQPAIEKIVALAVLMPIVASMGGNAGTQTLTAAVRSLATKELDRSNAPRILGKEVLAGVVNGLLFAFCASLIAWIWFQDVGLGVIIGAAMVVNLIAAGLFGIAIPLILDRINIDPAAASSVFLTTITDVVGFFTFLALAAAFLL